VDRFGRVFLSTIFLGVAGAACAEAQLASELSGWLRPLPRCQTANCIVNGIPTTPRPSRPGGSPWSPVGNPGPITTTPEPVTMALLGTGLVGIGFLARRRERENGELV